MFSAVRAQSVGILTLFGVGTWFGTPNQNFSTDIDIRAQKSTSCINLNVLSWKTKKNNFDKKFDPFWGQEPKTGPPNQNFSTDIISGPKNQHPV